MNSFAFSAPNLKTILFPVLYCCVQSPAFIVGVLTSVIGNGYRSLVSLTNNETLNVFLKAMKMIFIFVMF